MEIERPNAKPLSAQQIAHLEKLKSVVEKALENGKFSTYEADHIKSIMWSDGKISYEELRTLHETVKSVTGNEYPELEWQSCS